MFAFADGARIEGSAYFAGGGRAAGAHILVKDAGGRTVAELSPAADGSFSYVAQAPVDHLIVADSGDGHRAEWKISAAELASGFAERKESVALQTAPRTDAGASVAESATATSVQPTLPAPVIDPALEAAIERAVARQMRPLREELIAARDAYRLRDILGGIGYIFGLAGLALWWHARRFGNRR